MELWDAYDKFGNKLDFKLVRGEPMPKDALHLVVHMVYINDADELLIQRRAETKTLAPGMWSITGGSALAGEDSWAACVRETEEELGFTPEKRNSEVFLSFHANGCIVDVYLIKTNVKLSELKLQKDEVAEAMWMPLADFKEFSKDHSKFWRYRYANMLFEFIESGGWE